MSSESSGRVDGYRVLDADDWGELTAVYAAPLQDFGRYETPIVATDPRARKDGHDRRVLNDLAELVVSWEHGWETRNSNWYVELLVGERSLGVWRVVGEQKVELEARLVHSHD